jgi:hypothetical protein
VILNGIKIGKLSGIYSSWTVLSTGAGQTAINTMTIVRWGEGVRALASGKPCRGLPMPEAQANEHSSGQRRQ